MFIIYDPFESEIVDAADINNIGEVLNVFLLTSSIVSYVYLVELTFASLRQLLATLSNWFNNGHYSIQATNDEFELHNTISSHIDEFFNS
jgi:hypothetical protein